MTQLFHREVGIPEALHHTLPYPNFRYSRHAIQAAREDNLTNLPTTLPERFDVVEIETLNGLPHKWTLCLPFSTYDLFVVVMRDGFVKTVWTWTSAEHKALQLGRYCRPEEHSTERV